MCCCVVGVAKKLSFCCCVVVLGLFLLASVVGGSVRGIVGMSVGSLGGVEECSEDPERQL